MRGFATSLDGQKRAHAVQRSQRRCRNRRAAANRSSKSGSAVRREAKLHPYGRSIGDAKKGCVTIRRSSGGVRLSFPTRA
jgi:hypothetical protein